MERTQQHIPFFETLWIGCLLAIGGGFLDAYTYQLHGHVFANAQTGNLVLLGIQMANGHFLTALYYLIPIIAFIAGILLTELIKRRGNFRWILWQHLALCFEIMLLFGNWFSPPFPSGQHRQCNGFLYLRDSGQQLRNASWRFLCHYHVYWKSALRNPMLLSSFCRKNRKRKAKFALFYDSYLFLRRRRSGRFSFCSLAGKSSLGLLWNLPCGAG